MKRIVFLIVLLTLSFRLTGQYRIDDGSELLTLQKVPMEKIYVHLSSTLLFSGEYLYYKLYAMDARTGRLNPTSRVAYVSLVDSSGNEVLRQKLRLLRGMAQGDFFVNTDLPSGNYTFIAYTRWMQNGGLDQIFKQDLAILNPYRSDQSVFLKAAQDSSDRVGEDSTGMAAESSSGVETADPAEREAPALSQGGLMELLTDSMIYATRAPVELEVRNFKGNLGYGQYSLQVRQVSDLPEPEITTAESFSKDYGDVGQVLPQGIGDSIYLPEQRGELIFGRVLDAQTGNPAPDREVVISIPGEEFILKSAMTDGDGYFFSYLRKAYATDQIYFQVTNEGNYSIQPGKGRALPLKSLTKGRYTIDKAFETEIIARSTRNQLENAYFEKKPDTLAPREETDPFEGGIPEVIELDDYTRFTTFQETLVEILSFVGYRNAPGDKDYLRVAQDFETYDEPYNDDAALLLIDGVFIPDPGNYKTFNARRIKTIRVLRDPLVMGSKTYQGMVVVETFEGDFAESYTFKNGTQARLKLPEAPKRYYQQDHSREDSKRIPDYRQQLLWEPMLEVDAPSSIYTFYTSDLPGTYEIILEGFTTYGKPVSIRQRFEVR